MSGWASSDCSPLSLERGGRDRRGRGGRVAAHQWDVHSKRRKVCILNVLSPKEKQNLSGGSQKTQHNFRKRSKKLQCLRISIWPLMVKSGTAASVLIFSFDCLFQATVDINPHRNSEHFQPLSHRSSDMQTEEI